MTSLVMEAKRQHDESDAAAISEAECGDDQRDPGGRLVSCIDVVAGGAMKERPILFSPPMVQALLDGRKTQTRRVIKLNQAGRAVRAGRNWHPGDPNADKACPYGIPGDRLWVRETWAIGISTGNSWHSEDGRIKAISEPQRYQRRYAANGTDGFFGKWRPSIFMPRWASRITLEITEIRVQRLQEISEEDAEAEGCVAKVSFSETRTVLAREGFSHLWESINGPDSWDANPWVWCVSFKKVRGV